MIIDIFEKVLITPVMILLWSSVIVTATIVAYKTKLYGVMVIAGGVLPYLIFYSYRQFGIWNTHPYAYAILYSRIAGLSLCVSLSLALWLMYRSMRDGQRSSNLP